MKKIIISLGIGALLMSGAFISSKSLQNSDKVSNTKNVAVGEKEPRLFSTYSTSALVYES